MVNGLPAMSFSVEWIGDCFLLKSCGVSCSVHLPTSRTQGAEGSSFSLCMVSASAITLNAQSPNLNSILVLQELQGQSTSPSDTRHVIPNVLPVHDNPIIYNS